MPATAVPISATGMPAASTATATMPTAVMVSE
jgi:hypothetical protein